jgi:hypothetical protein
MYDLNAKKIRFYIDHLLRSGSNSLLGWLGILSLVFVFAITALTWLSGLSDHEGFGDLLWDLTMRAITPWEIEASMGALPYLLVLLIVTLFGIFVLSILISLLSTIIDARVRNVSKGLQDFPFDNHIIIFGWSSRVPAIIEELAIANESEGSSRIIIASNLASEELETVAKNTLGSLRQRTTQIFLRNRKLDSSDTFKNLNLIGAKRAIVLGDETETRYLDRLKITISLHNYLQAHDRSSSDIIVESENTEEATALTAATKGAAVPIVVSNLPARLIVETVFQPNLPSVYEELLSFSGNEIYLTKTAGELAIANTTFGESCRRFSSSIPIGYVTEAGEVRINSDQNARLSLSDRLIVIAEDDSLIHAEASASDPVAALDEAVTLREPGQSSPKINVFLLGASGSTPEILARLISAGRCDITLVVEANRPLRESTRSLIEKGLVKLIEAHYFERESLVGSGALSADTVIVSNYDIKSPENSDLKIIQTILILDSDSHFDKKPHLIAELNSSDSRDMMAELYDLDFVVSDKIGSKIFAQYAENPQLIQVIDALVSSGEHGIGIGKVQADPKMSFGQFRRAFGQSGKILIGLRFQKDRTMVTEINPGDAYRLPEQADHLEAIYVR